MKTHLQINHDSYFKLKRLREKKVIENLDGEVWKSIVGYEERYEVSNKGRVKGLERITITKKYEPHEIPSKILYGNRATEYNRITLFKNGKRESWQVHRLVCRAFHENPDNKPCVNHIDGDKWNNNEWNLEWCTHKENSIHAYKIGLSSGESRSRSIAMCDMNNYIIEEFDSIRQAMRKYNYKTIMLIINAAKGNRDSAYGYKWKYL